MFDFFSLFFRESIVFGVPDPKYMELPTALVALNPGYEVKKDLD